MMLQTAATMLRDTVFVQVQNSSSREGWAFTALMSVFAALATWALLRTVDHAQRLQKIETFTGVDNDDGLAGKIDKLTHSNEVLVSTMQRVELSVARLEERGTSHIRMGS